LVGVVAAAVIAGGGAFVLSTRDSKDGDNSARSHAVAACAAADRFDKAIRSNDDIDSVRKELNTALRHAHAAEQKNSLYVGLTSGLEALRVAIDRDDPQAAKVGIAVVRAECGYVRRERQAGS
jgi:hypothetical protein